MDFEHEFSEFPHRSEGARGTLEENARRSAKVAAWSRGIHVADPEGTMKRMFQKFIGDKLQQQLEIQSTRAAEEAPPPQPATSSSSSSSSSSKKKTKKAKKVKTKKKEKKKKSIGKKKKSEMMVRLKRERQEADREVPLDPKFAKIINRFRQNEVPDPSLPQHPFVIGEHKQVDEVRTLRLDEAGEVPSSSSSSSSSSVSPKEKLAKSCLKPWRSPVEAYLGKSFIFPQRRGSARASELLGASMHKSGSQKTAERTVAPVAQEEEAEVTATSHSAWEKIKRTHGFAALCHAHPRNDR
eukprot:s864_g5.t2